MNLFKDPSIVFKPFEQEYILYKSSCYKLVDDSVIRICGFRNFRNYLFDVNYTCVPVFSQLYLNSSFLNEATAFSAQHESGINPTAMLWIAPNSENEKEIIETASAQASYAYKRLETVNTLDDCLRLYAQMFDQLLRDGICSSPRRYHLDILIFQRKFDECKALLEKALLNNVHWSFNYCKTDFPADGNWRSYLPESYETATSQLQRNLSRTENSCWKNVRTQLEEHRYYELCSELMQTYRINKKLLKKVGIQLGEKSDEMMEEMMHDIEKYR